MQDLLGWHPLLQRGALDWLAAAEGSWDPAADEPGGAAPTGPWQAPDGAPAPGGPQGAPASAAALLPLLRLLACARDGGVRGAAARLAARRLEAMVGFEESPAEAGLWLGLLPRGPPAGGDAARRARGSDARLNCSALVLTQCCCWPRREISRDAIDGPRSLEVRLGYGARRRCDAVAAFLADTAALVARRPGELFELTQALLGDARGRAAAPASEDLAHGDPSSGAPTPTRSGAAGRPGGRAAAGGPVPAPAVSLLAAAALRQALRVAVGGKTEPAARGAVAAYVAGAAARLSAVPRTWKCASDRRSLFGAPCTGPASYYFYTLVGIVSTAGESCMAELAATLLTRHVFIESNLGQP